MTPQPLSLSTSYVRQWTDRDIRWFDRADGSRLRYLVAGDGPPVLLLHTVRTQLDYFQRVIPLLSTGHRVYALDFPGMGWSDIVPGAAYEHAELQAAVIEFVEALDLSELTLAGESMGAVVALTASVPLATRVARVAASNPYDYARGIERANLLAATIVPAVKAPVIGPLFAGLENKPIVRGIMRGGYADPDRLPDAFVDEAVRVGHRPGYAAVARAVFRNLPSLIDARTAYPRISVPVSLAYGSADWSRERDRTANASVIPGVAARVWDRVGHFSAMEAPERFAALVLGAPPVE